MNVSAEYALRNAVASMEIEGFEISEYERKKCMDALNRKITNAEFIKLMLERFGA